MGAEDGYSASEPRPASSLGEARRSSRTTKEYFPRSTSIARRVMEERIVALYYGQRASLVGALEALAFVGTTRHTYSGGGKLYARMLRTATSFETIWHGSTDEADAELARVADLHATVQGTISRDIAPQYPAGTRYAASDPWLSYMTMAFLADSDLVARTGRRVRPVLPRALATGRLTPLGRALLPYAEARLTSRVRDARRRRATAATTGGA